MGRLFEAMGYRRGEKGGIMTRLSCVWRRQSLGISSVSLQSGIGVVSEW